MTLEAWNEADWLLSVPWPCEYHKDRLRRVVTGGGEVQPSRPCLLEDGVETRVEEVECNMLEEL